MSLAVNAGASGGSGLWDGGSQMGPSGRIGLWDKLDALAAVSFRFLLRVVVSEQAIVQQVTIDKR